MRCDAVCRASFILDLRAQTKRHQAKLKQREKNAPRIFTRSAHAAIPKKFQFATDSVLSIHKLSRSHMPSHLMMHHKLPPGVCPAYMTQMPFRLGRFSLCQTFSRLEMCDYALACAGACTISISMAFLGRLSSAVPNDSEQDTYVHRRCSKTC